MTSRSNKVLLASGLALAAGCAPTRDAAAKPPLPPPEAVKAVGKAMLTTHGFIHPEDPLGTRRASRPHGFYIYPCSDWAPWQGLTDDYGKTIDGPFMISGSVTLNKKPGSESVTASMLTALYGPPHPATRTVVVGDAMPLGPHWTWQLKPRPGQIPVLSPGQTLIAEARPDGSVRYHFAQIGTHKDGGATSASFMVQCLIEWHGTPGWELGQPWR
ncbi:MAG: hypothetical protein R3F65_24380 [bacterium]